MVKKTISFTLIIILFFFVYQYIVTFLKSNHYVTYTIDNGELFNVDEKYIKENGADYYLIKVSNNDRNFVFKVDNSFNKQKNIVSDIETFEQDDYYCIGLKYAGNKYYSYPECYKDGIVYTYSSVKDEVPLTDYVKKITDKNKERYSKDSTKENDKGAVISKDYIEDDEIFMIYEYKSISLFYPNYSRTFSFSGIDTYKNEFGRLVGKYYVVPRLTTQPTIKTLVKYDVIDGIKNEISLSVEISKQAYINGVKDNKLYIFDKSNLRQYEFNPYNDEMNMIGNQDDDGIAYINGEKKEMSVYDLEKDEVIFSENSDSYSSIECDSIYLGDKYAVYSKDGYYYKVYEDFVDSPILLFYEPEAHEVKLVPDRIFYVKGDTIYKHNEYGDFLIAKRNEFTYNYDNIYDVYIK